MSSVSSEDVRGRSRGFRIASPSRSNGGKKKSPAPCFHRRRGVTLAMSYFRTTYRSTIIGAAAFHFRVRNGNGWDHRAGITRRLGSADSISCLRGEVLRLLAPAFVADARDSGDRGPSFRRKIFFRIVYSPSASFVTDLFLENRG